MKPKYETGGEGTLDSAKKWDEYMLGRDALAKAEESRPRYRVDQGEGFDTIEITYRFKEQTVVTRQTRYAWSVRYGDQQLEEGSDFLAGVQAMNLARQVFEPDFLYREFRMVAQTGEVKLFAGDSRDMIAERDHRTSDWRDLVWAVVEPKMISFVTVKRTFSAGSAELDVESNREWFRFERQR